MEDSVLISQTNWKLFILGLVVSIAGSEPAKAGVDQAILLAGIEMKLGMPRDVVMDALKGKYDLSQVGDSDSWNIAEKGAPPYDLVGGVAFEEGKLTWVSRNWGAFHEPGAAVFAKELFSVLNIIAAESGGVARVRANTAARQPGLTVEKIELEFGSKRVTIFISEDRESGELGVSMQEILEP